jgi:hypothetical protein
LIKTIPASGQLLPVLRGSRNRLAWTWASKKRIIIVKVYNHSFLLNFLVGVMEKTEKTQNFEEFGFWFFYGLR